MIPNATECCFYRIREGTKDEYVAVGFDGDIVRWGPTGGKEQEWLILPLNDQHCRIMSRQNGEFMAVGFGGDVIRWGETGKADQVFDFDPVGNGSFLIREFTKGEVVAVGPNGDVLRWGETGGKEQRFRLEPSHPRLKPALSPAKRHEPGQIPDIPRIAALASPPPDRSPSYLIGEVVVPAVLVNDSKYHNRIVQVENNPYYVLKREQYWDRMGDRGGYIEHSGAGTRKEKVTFKVGLSETRARQVEKTTNTKFTADLKVNFEIGQAPVPGGSFWKVAPVLSIAHEHFEGTRITQTNSTTLVHERTEEQEVVLPEGKAVTVALWSLVDSWSLRRMDGKVVESWEIVTNQRIEDKFAEGDKPGDDNEPPPPSTWPDRTLLKEENTAPVYVICGGAKFHVPTPTVLHDLYGGWANVRVVPDGTTSSIPTTPRDGTILREVSSAPVYLIEGGKKRRFVSPEVLANHGGWAVVRVIHDGALDPFPQGPDVTS